MAELESQYVASSSIPTFTSSASSASSASDTNNSSPDTTMIVTIVLVSLLIIIICGPILCCMWAHRKIERADKLQYFKDKETEPSLTYTIWKERKMQAFELQEADKEFRKFKEREERAGKGRKSIFGKASKQKAQKTGVKSLFWGPPRRKVLLLVGKGERRTRRGCGILQDCNHAVDEIGNRRVGRKVYLSLRVFHPIAFGVFSKTDDLVISVYSLNTPLRCTARKSRPGFCACILEQNRRRPLVLRGIRDNSVSPGNGVQQCTTQTVGIRSGHNCDRVHVHICSRLQLDDGRHIDNAVF